MIVPVGVVVRNARHRNDVIHSWAVPSLGVKIDAIPGRLNEIWFRADREGVYYGQCSELCGQAPATRHERPARPRLHADRGARGGLPTSSPPGWRPWARICRAPTSCSPRRRRLMTATPTWRSPVRFNRSAGTFLRIDRKETLMASGAAYTAHGAEEAQRGARRARASDRLAAVGLFDQPQGTSARCTLSSPSFPVSIGGGLSVAMRAELQSPGIQIFH